MPFRKANFPTFIASWKESCWNAASSISMPIARRAKAGYLVFQDVAGQTLTQVEGERCNQHWMVPASSCSRSTSSRTISASSWSLPTTSKRTGHWALGKLNLNTIFSLQNIRVVNNEYTISAPRQEVSDWDRKRFRVTVVSRLSGDIKFEHKDYFLYIHNVLNNKYLINILNTKLSIISVRSLHLWKENILTLLQYNFELRAY